MWSSSEKTKPGTGCPALTACPLLHSHSPCVGAWCSLCPPHTRRQPPQPELPSKHTPDGVALLLKTPRFSPDREQNFCPGSKPSCLLLQAFAAAGHTAPCALRPIPWTGSWSSPQGLCQHVLFLPGLLFAVPFCLIILMYHFALTFTSLCREPDLPDHSGLDYFLVRDHATLHDIMEHCGILHWLCPYLFALSL